MKEITLSRIAKSGDPGNSGSQGKKGKQGKTDQSTDKKLLKISDDCGVV